jgi:hypothetical protein
MNLGTSGALPGRLGEGGPAAAGCARLHAALADSTSVAPAKARPAGVFLRTSRAGRLGGLPGLGFQCHPRRIPVDGFVRLVAGAAPAFRSGAAVQSEGDRT